MGHKIITIGRQFGSGGHEIGERLSKALDIPLYDRDLVEMVLPGLEKPYPHQTLGEQSRAFTEAGFHVELACEAYRPIVFYDVGAFVWFARVLPWEFPGFSVDRCLERLLRMQAVVEKEGKVQGTIHRFLIVAKK